MKNHENDSVSQIKLLLEEVSQLRRQVSTWRGRAESAETRILDLELQIVNLNKALGL